jgi:hypothetical protein
MDTIRRHFEWHLQNANSTKSLAIVFDMLTYMYLIENKQYLIDKGVILQIEVFALFMWTSVSKVQFKIIDFVKLYHSVKI